MTLQAKLTLGSVLLATLIVTLVSVVDLGHLMDFQFNNMLERSELIKWAATDAVKDALTRPPLRPYREALRPCEVEAIMEKHQPHRVDRWCFEALRGLMANERWFLNEPALDTGSSCALALPAA